MELKTPGIILAPYSEVDILGMTKLKDIVKFLDKYLKNKEIKDTSRNGLQVKGGSEISKIAFAENASLDTFKMALKEKAFEYGAQAFKHKGLNYFEWDRLVRDDRSRTGNREDSIYTDLLVKSGEPFIREGRQPTIRLLMPNSRWKKSYVGNLEERDVSMINFGYSGLNDIDWGYIN